MSNCWTGFPRPAQDSYPPYNIEQIDDTRLRVSLAVAGFAEDDLSVTVDGNQLMIRGRQSDEGQRVFLHRGIAARQFQRNFVLADGLEVAGARLETGLLHIEINRPLPATNHTHDQDRERTSTPNKAPKLKAVGDELRPMAQQ